MENVVNRLCEVPGCKLHGFALSEASVIRLAIVLVCQTLLIGFIQLKSPSTCMGGESLDEGVVLWRGCPVGVHVFKRERVVGDSVGEIFVVVCVAGDCHPVCWRALPATEVRVARVNEIYIPLQLYQQGKHYKVCIHVIFV